MAFKSAKAYNQMSDELESIDDELKTICSEMRRDLEGIVKRKSDMPFDQINVALHGISVKLENARSLFKKAKLELRELLSDQKIHYESKLKEYARIIDETASNVASERESLKVLQSQNTDRTKLFGSREQSTPNGMGLDAQELMKQAGSTQAESKKTLNRIEILVNQSEEIGVNTVIQLKSQTEQMGTIKSDVDKVQANMKVADRLLNKIGRSLMTDKLLMCLVLLVILGIVVIIVLKVLGIDLKSASQGVLVIDCSMEWAKNFQECQEIVKT